MNQDSTISLTLFIRLREKYLEQITQVEQVPQKLKDH